MITATRVVTWVLAALLAAGLVVLAVAGVPAAAAVLVTAVAVVVMIVLGGAIGGRGRPSRMPVPLHRQEDAAGDDDAGGTMEG